LPFIPTVHHRRSLIIGLFEYFDHSRIKQAPRFDWCIAATMAILSHQDRSPFLQLLAAS
jgi:hypothetical protein